MPDPSALKHADTSNLKIDQAVVYFPGTLCDERIFNPLWQCIDNNMRAFVPLQWAEDLTQMQMLANDRLDYFEQAVHLVGYSMGGYIAALTAIQNKQRIASLTLIGSACDALPKAEIQQRQQLIRQIKNKQYTGMTNKRLQSFFHPCHHTNSDYLNTVKQMEQDLGPSVLATQIEATQARKNLLPQLAKCDFPIHIVCGEQDNLLSVNSVSSMHQALPNSHKVIVENAGHMLPIEQPQVLAGLLAKLLG